jgi:O-antigen/teichoic acid export membrane protein
VTTGVIHPLLAILFGAKWLPTSDVVIYSSLGWLLVASIGATLSSLALVDGDGKTPLVAAAAGASVQLALTAALARPFGPAGAGAAAGAGMIIATAVLMVRTSVGHATTGRAARASVITVGTAAAGLAAARGTGLRDLIIGGVAAATVWCVISFALMRNDLRTAVRLTRAHLFGSV